MPTFQPRLDILPPPQRALWTELDATPDHFTLYGGTALALRLGHRQSVDFDFFSRTAFNPGDLAREIPYLAEAEQSASREPYLDLPGGTRRPGAGVVLRQSRAWRSRAARDSREVKVPLQPMPR
jgi:Nucleotidyl transferase AbiEii toxin, Type IV TA system